MGLQDMEAAGKSGYQTPRKRLCNWMSLEKGTKSAPQHSKMCLEVPRHFGSVWPSKALAWPLTGMKALSWGAEVMKGPVAILGGVHMGP